MKEHMKNFNEQKMREAYRIKESFKKGEIDLAMANAQMKAHVGQITPDELAYIEQEFQEMADEECIKESVEEMLAIYDGVLVSDEINQYHKLADGHPIKNYYDENSAIKDVVKQLEALLEKPYIKNEWDEKLENLNTFKTHLSRKQNQLYTALERKGFDRPTQTMWLYDNEVRDQISNFTQMAKRIEDTGSEELREGFSILRSHLLDLMSKEETILYPTSLELLTDSDISELAEGDLEIGYALISPPKFEAAAPQQNIEEEEHLSEKQSAAPFTQSGRDAKFAEELD
ncbi:MAG: hemerythrin domain-containing protein, partial [Bacillota bacterium]|nr:hemerythrin domain-containing protein [Bacillota bacterium]